MPDRLVRLRAEMKLPGEAWLEWRIEPPTSTPTIASCTLHQLARYHPRGLLGRAYWLAVAPFHRFVFPDMVDGHHRRRRAAARGLADRDQPASTVESVEPQASRR